MGWIRVGRTRESTTCGSDNFRRENPHGCADRTGRRGPKRIRYKIRVGKENVFFFGGVEAMSVGGTCVVRVAGLHGCIFVPDMD